MWRDNCLVKNLDNGTHDTDMKIRATIAAGLLCLPALAHSAIVMETGAAPVSVVPFQTNFFAFDDSSLGLSGLGAANSLFTGQGWDLTAAQDPALGLSWELPVGSPTPGPLALAGQYSPSYTPPGPSPAVDPTKIQNVASSDRFGGMVDNQFLGITSILFDADANTFGVEILDAGITQNDGNGGPLHFAFYDRGGSLLQQFDITQAVDGNLRFLSDAVDLAGVQIWHQDPRGLEFRTLRFGVVPEPGTVVLVSIALVLLTSLRRLLGTAVRS